jgi:hypothetical protein
MNERVARLNLKADRAKRQMNQGQGTRGGGDPDLFMFKGRERFFVEVMIAALSAGVGRSGS